MTNRCQTCQTRLIDSRARRESRDAAGHRRPHAQEPGADRHRDHPRVLRPGLRDRVLLFAEGADLGGLFPGGPHRRVVRDWRVAVRVEHFDRAFHRPGRIGRVVATGVYTIAGGLAAVIYTDLVQTLILIAGAVILTAIGLDRVGGFAALRAAVPESYFHMIKPASDPDFPWTGIFFGAPILGIWYWCTDQVIVQRVLSAKDEGHAKAATIFAGFLKILPVFMLVLPGLIAVALYRDLFRFGPHGEVLNGDIAYPTLIINLLPTGLVGVMIAALLAALMGAMSSVFNSASTLVTLDFYKKIKPDATELQLVGFGRVMTGFMVILGLAWVPFIHLISSQLYIYLQSVQGYISPPIAACFILGILWPRLNAQGAITSLLTGFVLGAVRFIFELMDRAAGGHAFDNGFLRGLVGMNFLHYAILMFVICCAVLVGVSLMTPAPERRKLAGLTFATVDEKMDVTPLTPSATYKPPAETALEHRINIAFSLALVATVVGLWIHFR